MCPQAYERMKTAVAASLLAAGLAGYHTKRRSSLSTRMNLTSSFLIDPSELFPLRPFPQHNRAEQLELVRAKRKEWEEVGQTLGKIISKKPVGIAEDIEVPSRDASRTIKCRVYRPLDAQGLLPVMLEIHGGGWTFGSVDVYDGFCRSMCDLAKVVVVSVDYRLAPEHKFPCGLEDCEDTLKWIASAPAVLRDRFGGDALQKGLGVSGDSAGGNLAAILAVKAANEFDIHLDMQVLIYPATCASGIPLWRPSPHVPLSTDSIFRNSRAPVLPVESLAFCWQSYLSPIESSLSEEQVAAHMAQLIVNPEVSPILYDDSKLSKVAPCLVITAEADVLLDEGREFAKKLKRAGVAVEYKQYPDAIHAFVSLPTCVNHKESNDAIGEYIRKHFAKRNNVGTAKL